jgi:tetratricopeptide (TPR) repeat protein
VEFILGRFGLESLRQVLLSLRAGKEINAALAEHTMPIEKLEEEFAAYARERAEKLAPGLDWEKPEPGLFLPEAAAELAAFEAKHPDNYWLMRTRAQRLMEEEKWQEAVVPLRRLVELYPAQKGGDTAYRPLATALRALNDTAGEREVLRKWVEVDDEATEAYLRVAEFAAAEQDWPTVIRNAERYLAVNPLVPPPYRFLAKAAAGLGDDSAAVVAWRTLIQLDVPERADAHYQLARLLHKRGDHSEARRHALLALEETPRYREALRLLAEINRARSARLPEAAPIDELLPARKTE